MYRIFFTISLLFIAILQVGAQNKTKLDTILYKIMPNNVRLQYAGNIGMFAIGIGYVSPNQKWKGELFYGIVPSDYADDPIHSMTIKGKFAPINRKYKNDLKVNWLNIGILFNYSFGDKYFLGLPEYYDKGYYYFPTALNTGLFLGSEIRHKDWGLYYELGTTEKRVINYVKNLHAIDFSEIWNIGIGVVYHLK